MLVGCTYGWTAVKTWYDPFDNLTNWVIGGPTGNSSNTFINSGTLKFTATTPGTNAYRERNKVEVNHDSLNANDVASHTWRIYIPDFAPGYPVSVSGFLYQDEHTAHELDWECGYGSPWLRGTFSPSETVVASTEDTYVCVMTAQDSATSDGETLTVGVALGQKFIPISSGYHDFAIVTYLDANNELVAEWYLDGNFEFSVSTHWTPNVGNRMTPRCSFENLASGYMGYWSASPQIQESAWFDSYTYTSPYTD